MDVLLWILLGAAVIWYWSDTSKAREVAIQHGRRACKDMNLQFLDGTVIRYSTRPKRGPNGQMCLCRDFGFEFTDDGIRRYTGHIQLLGQRLKKMNLDYHREGEEEASSNLIMDAEYSKLRQSQAASAEEHEERPKVVNLTDFRDSRKH
ncbi:DUF3301 domain-containing protein [Endozoicomonas sp. OPT23]|uniref:DUF3301 domain-containing protein n=1 Tax=Endozoicomonas sp. OPT23 TaxID=2072845 RepID=UPI00129B2D26|nr:DUF3301 domain-containing protein [Endozoicomonas sp. OPT23]MRI34074.1 DUF3301 domain-containing protein [Endozoicomonas sp. OPT23]